MRTRELRLGSAAVVGPLLLVLSAGPAAAQSAPPAISPMDMPVVIHACYVPSTGTIYRIKEPGLPQQCTGPNQGPNQNVEFNWNQKGPQGSPGDPGPPGPPGTTDHSQLINLDSDDHPQYLLTQGVRDSPGGFTVTGTHTFGGNPRVQGAGTRLMWIPFLSAFRAGRVAGTHWDGANIGQQSVAMGFNTTASGHNSFAMGEGTIASNHNTTAMGQRSTASGVNSTAIGTKVTASGDGSTAIGWDASTNGYRGAFVYGDGSTFDEVVTATAPNQFTVRAAGGFRFRTSPDLSTGCNLPAGSGTWSCTSSRFAKMNFEEEDGEEVLDRLARLPVQSWSYISEGAQVRHLGPTAEDFHGAFGLGSSEEAIAHVDADGINMLAIQALERRTTELRAENAALRRQNEELERRLARLEALPQR
jgi:hypothetical protein